MSKEKNFCVSRQNSVLSFTSPNLSFECSTEFGGTLLHFEPSADYGDDELSEGEVVYNCKLSLFGIVAPVSVRVLAPVSVRVLVLQKTANSFFH